MSELVCSLSWKRGAQGVLTDLSSEISFVFVGRGEIVPYKHIQIGYFLIVIMTAAALIAAVLNSIIFILIAVVGGILFSTLTVFVNGNSIRLWFGPGFLPQRIALSDIVFCEVLKKHWGPLGIWGWPGKFWFFNVSGSRFVELEMRNGVRYYIGTDRPEDLKNAIYTAMHEALHLAIKIE